MCHVSCVVNYRHMVTDNDDDDDDDNDDDNYRHMVTDHRVNRSETFPNISQWFAGQYGFETIEEFREQLEQEDKNDQFLRIITES